jgi:vancomycin resistance protein YoaR
MSNDRHDRGNFTWKDPRAFFGALLIVLFGAFVSFLSMRADAWEHYLSLYTGVTAVMTGILGAILGVVLTNSRVQDAKTEMNHAIIERQETQGKLEAIYSTLADARETMAKVELVLREAGALRHARKNDETKFVERIGFDSSMLNDAVNTVRDDIPPEAEFVDTSRVHEVDPKLDTLAVGAEELLDEVRTRHRYLRRPTD